VGTNFANECVIMLHYVNFAAVLFCIFVVAVLMIKRCLLTLISDLTDSGTACNTMGVGCFRRSAQSLEDGHGRRPDSNFQGWMPSSHFMGQCSLDANRISYTMVN